MRYGQRRRMHEPGSGRVGVSVLLALCIVMGLAVWLGRRGHGEVKGIISPTVERVIIQSPTPMPLDDKTRLFVKSLQEITATVSGTYAVWVQRLETKETYGFNTVEPVQGGSLLKVPAMVVLWKKMASGQVSTTSAFTLTEDDRLLGSGPLQYEPVGTQVTADDLLRLMGQNSDNTAWRMTNRIVGRDSVAAIVHDLGLESTSYDTFMTTAENMGRMFVELETGPYLDPTGKAKIYSYLQNTAYEDRISAAASDQLQVVHKVATLDDAWQDVALVRCKEDQEGGCGIRPFVLAILNSGVDRDEAAQIVPEIARRVLAFERAQAAE